MSHPTPPAKGMQTCVSADFDGQASACKLPSCPARASLLLKHHLITGLLSSQLQTWRVAKGEGCVAVEISRQLDRNTRSGCLLIGHYAHISLCLKSAAQLEHGIE